MSPVELEIAYRAAQRAQPGFQLDRTLLNSVLRAAPPPKGAPMEERQAHIGQVVAALCALAPRDPVQAMLAAQIVASRHAAAESARQSLDPRLGAKQAARMGRMAETLLRTAERTECALRRAQGEPRTQGRRQVAPAAAVDAAALAEIWRERGQQGRNRTASPTPTPAAGIGTGDGENKPGAVALSAEVRGMRPAATRPDPVTPMKFTLCGQRIDQVKLETIPVAGTA